MTTRILFFILAMSVYGHVYCYTGSADTATVPITVAPQVRLDTAVVRSYNGVPVFYHCTPLHPYVNLGQMSRVATVKFISRAFDKYTKAARKRSKADHIGIIIDDANFGVDSFQVVQFTEPDINIDTALYSTPIFLSSMPTRAYDVVAIIKGETSWGSLNLTLQRYFADARILRKDYDAIMVRDIDYTFGTDDVIVVRWKK